MTGDTVNHLTQFYWEYAVRLSSTYKRLDPNQLAYIVTYAYVRSNNVKEQDFRLFQMILSSMVVKGYS